MRKVKYFEWKYSMVLTKMVKEVCGEAVFHKFGNFENAIIELPDGTVKISLLNKET